MRTYRECLLHSVGEGRQHGGTGMMLCETLTMQCSCTYDMLRGSRLKLVTVLLPEAYLEGLDELVRANMYPSRSSAIRSSVRDMLKKELWERRGR